MTPRRAAHGLQPSTEGRPADRAPSARDRGRPCRPRRRSLALLAVVALALQLAGCASERYARPRPGMTQRGVASWYGPQFHGRPTASGEIYDMDGMTAAHRELPMGTRVHVRNLDNGRETVVVVNDRGPFVRGRILDLSRGAARVLGVIGPGTARVEIRILDVGEGRAGPSRYSRYTLQVGAYRDRANAEAMVARLAGLGEDARLELEAGWHRVRVGRFGDRAEAEKAERRLASRGVESVVVGLH